MIAQDEFFIFYFLLFFVKEKSVQLVSFPLVYRLFSLSLFHFILPLILSILVKF